MKIRLLVFTALLVMFAFTVPSFAESKVVIKIATITPEKTPWMNYLTKWKDNLLAESNGNIEIKLFPAGQLGNEFDVMKQVKRGRIGGAGFSAAPFNGAYPEIALLSLPFLIDKVEGFDCIIDTQLNDEYSAILEKDGMKLLKWIDAGSVNVYAKDDLSDPADAKGYKIRVSPHPSSRLLWTSLSANGIELPYVETPAALQTGMVLGGESSLLAYYAFGFSKIAPHLMLTNHYHQSGAVVLGLKLWKSLSADQQKMVMDALPPASDQRNELRAVSKAMMEKSKTAGGHAYELTEEQLLEWKKLVEPNWPNTVKKLGPKAKAFWPKVLQAKKDCGC